jgi:ABC-type bacteriocin/lantibiotic exporter with double-glycine peptidase domain
MDSPEHRPARSFSLTTFVRPSIGRLAFLSCFVNLLALAVPVFVLQVYDRVVFFAGLTTLQALAAGVLVAIAFDFVLRQARSRIIQDAALRIDATLGHALAERLARLPLAVLERRGLAQWHQYQRDVGTIRSALGGPPLLLAIDLPFVAIFIVLIAFVATPILWVLGVLVPIFVLSAVLSARSAGGATRAEQAAAISRDTIYSQLVAGRATVKALDMAAPLHRNLERAVADTIEASARRGRTTDGYSNFGTELSLLTTVALTSVGALAILDQQLTIGALIAANMLAGRIISPLNQLVTSWRSWAQYGQARRRLEELFALAEERSSSGIALPRPQGKLTAERLTFRYDGSERPAIDEVTFALGVGGMHGIVGANGSGKSTLLKLLQGLYAPSGGRVLLDGADIAQFSRFDLSRWIGYVPQESFLISGTIRDNIARFNTDIDDAAIISAATLAGAHGFISALPAGYATEVGEAGSILSGGQRQRLAVARALVFDPPVLLLDEPTAHLDRAAEHDLGRVLLDLSANRNIVTVSHSTVLLGACSDILMMTDGKITAAGNAADMLRRLGGVPAPVSPIRTAS